VALLGIHAVLKERAEDLGLHLRPIMRERGMMQGVSLAVLQLDGIDFRKEAAIELIDVSVSAAAGRLLTRHPVSRQ
jgi:hypothetical protein